jgi:hypothetical protein
MGKPKPDATTHHEPYPERLHRHLTGAVEAIAALSGPLAVEGDADTPGELVARYGGAEAPGGTEDE